MDKSRAAKIWIRTESSGNPSSIRAQAFAVIQIGAEQAFKLLGDRP
jgi:hypothetical protein